MVTITCSGCGTRMRVVKDSVPDQERLCNSCVMREARRGDAPTTYLP